MKTKYKKKTTDNTEKMQLGRYYSRIWTTGDEPPENSEGEPAQHETGRENENGPAPLNVHHGRENVRAMSWVRT